jgi:hypothetical protein
VGFGGFGAVTWAGRLGRHLSPSFLSSSPANNRAGGDWPSRKQAQGVGAARSRRRGHGPARLDGQAPAATVAGSAMKEGNDGLPAYDISNEHLRAGPTPRCKRPCVCLPTGARLAGGGPSVSRGMRMKNWPIRQRLFGCIAGAPNGVRRGWADQPIPWRQAQRAVPQGRRNRHQAQQRKAPPSQSAGTANWMLTSRDQSDAGATIV